MCLLVLLAGLARVAGSFHIFVNVDPVHAFEGESVCLLNTLMTLVELLQDLLLH